MEASPVEQLLGAVDRRDVDGVIYTGVDTSKRRNGIYGYGAYGYGR